MPAASLVSEHFLEPSIEIGSANLDAIHSAAHIVAPHARDSRRRAGLGSRPTQSSVVLCPNSCGDIPEMTFLATVA